MVGIVPPRSIQTLSPRVMKHIPHPYRTHSPGSALGKFVSSLFSLFVIAVLVFAGTRDWKSNRGLVDTLLDVSDIQGVLTHFEKTASKKAAKDHSIQRASNQLERSLIEKGTLIRESATLVDATPTTPQGLSRGR